MGKLAKMPRTTPKAGTITMSLGVLVFAENALRTLCALKLSAQAAYRLSKLARVVSDETKHYHETRDALIKELGTPTATGRGTVEIQAEIDGQPNPKIDEFQRRMIDLSNVAVELTVTPFLLADLGDHPVSASDLLALGTLVTDEA